MMITREAKAFAGGCFVLLLCGIYSRLLPNSAEHAAPEYRQGVAARQVVNDPAAKRAEIDDIIRRRGERMIRSAMKDPDSAEISESFGRVKHGKWIACGKVNGRNSFGAMAGNQAWVALVTSERAYINSDYENAAFAHNWNRYCTGHADPVDTNTEPAHIANRELKAAKLSCGHLLEAKTLTDGTVQATCNNHKRYRMNYIKETGDYIAYRCDDPTMLPSNRCT